MEEKEFELRDKFAIEIFNGLLSYSKSDNELVRNILHYITYDGEINSRDRAAIEKRSAIQLEKVIRNCYKVANIFRKVRLSTFE